MVEEATETTAQVTLTTSPSSARYLAPELIRGDLASPNMGTDIYSFAMAILECLTLQKPFAHRKLVCYQQAMKII
jgi:serine/threonine protein kinase